MDLINGLKLELLAEWLAIEHGKTRLQSLEYINEAQELADYLTTIGYILIDCQSCLKEHDRELKEALVKQIVLQLKTLSHFVSAGQIQQAIEDYIKE